MAKPEGEKGDKKQASIIIKRVKKISGGHHGGAWKVAYADFVTAMMAFFLLMWLITALKPQTKAAIASYFREGTEIVLERGGPPSPDIDRPPAADNEPINAGEGFSDSLETMNAINEAKEIQSDIKEIIEEELSDLKDQIIVELVDGNVRIEIVDKEQNPLFAVGSSALNDNAQKIIQELTKVILDVPNKVIIEGHTDSLNYKGSHYTNWELSTERASAARKILESKGMKEHRIAMVAGYASTNPLVKYDPSNPKNRRISIVILSNKTKIQKLYE